MLLKRLQSKRFLIILAISIIVIIAVSLLAVYIHYDKPSKLDIIPDPNEPLPPSSMPMGVYDKVGVVSNGEPCAEIGRNVLEKGGNAIDAIIATLICDGVHCPEYMGLGGGFLMTIYNGTTKTATAVNARESAPAAANETMFVNDSIKSQIGGLAIAIPGELKGYWTVFNKYGSGEVTWSSLFEPTIKQCEEGIAVSQRLAKNMANNEELIKNSTTLKKHFFDEKTGRVKKAGDIYKLPELAETMRIVAKHGADALYNGELTQQLIEDIKDAGGIITADDLANYNVEVEDAFNVTMSNGVTLHAGPPPGSGVILAHILRVLDGKLPAPNAGLDAHRLVEAFKFAYGERTHLGDHNFVNVTEIFRKIQSADYINEIQNKMNDHFTSLDPVYYGADFGIPADHGTANVVVLDALGNAVVATSTVNTIFGSMLMSKGTGIILNSEMDDFSTPGVPNYFGIPPSPANYIAPRKRPMSSMCPAIITNSEGDVVLAFGAAGGSKITLATSYVASLVLWSNKTLKEAVDEPRLYHQLVPMRIDYEYGVLRDVIKNLTDVGHPVKRLKVRGGSAVTAIHRTTGGKITAMADFRRPGNISGF
ncbi:scoloptoxin SSD14-like [Adelges cooleyi]|uniref:scoloptoxin SSD14-like n=1 Tax=Adelges cooleyi TaxID=133065 RepID=UPI0021805E9A|nr:scoloptoxin SSD14-like [Adelges cooleyi]XP_050430903.1 scoloptoxin SSD14-like [Adelges cooleyi]XP_050430913.1 scoloptoxin SSD14-like [Adelges cooleyi]XP_050430921.1 scoloptoxin SSD14-like [Adelges cooleyi]